MELTAGKVAVVTGAASGIGLALAERFARAGLDVVLADVEQPALQAAAQQVASLGVKTLAVPTDVSDEAAVNELAAASVDRFGAVHVVCNNAGVTSRADPWSGPVSAWRWVLGVNLWGVIHGIRAFLPLLTAQRESHIVNTASAAGLIPATTPAYDAAKHAVVAVSEDLYRAMKVAGLGVGVSVVCPGWVRAGIGLAERNWPQSLGEVPPPAAAAGVMAPHYRRAISEGMHLPPWPAWWPTPSPPTGSGYLPTPSSPRPRSTGGIASPKAAIPRSRSTCLASRPASNSWQRSGGCWLARARITAKKALLDVRQ